MNSIQIIKPPVPPRSATSQPSQTPNGPPFHSGPPSFEERLGEILPLVGVVPVAGPPVIFLVPWVLIALMLTGPFLLLVTFALAAVLLAIITAAVLAPPYLLVRHLRKYAKRQHERHPPAHGSRELHRIGVSLLTQSGSTSPIGHARSHSG